MELIELCKAVKTASKDIMKASTAQKNAVLESIAQEIEQHMDEIMVANQKDVDEGEKRGILIGEAQGEKRGILHTQKETAKNLQHMGMALEQISLALNVSVQMIQEWLSADYVPVK